MTSVFARLLVSFDGGGEPAEALFADAWGALRRVLVRQLELRSLWHAPPAYLGVLGRARWSDPAALEELLVDCWEFVFIDRLRGLRARLRAGAEIDGLVTRNVANFIFELQKRHDPLGYRLYVLLQAAVQQVLDEGGWRLLAGPPRPTSSSVLGIADSDPTLEPVAGHRLEPLVARWCDQLLPELVTADRAARLRLQGRLAERLNELPAGGIEAFRFADLVAALKAAVRSRWSTVWKLSQGETAIEGPDPATVELVRLVRPDRVFEDRDVFVRLGAEVEEAIDRLGLAEPMGGHLHQLWLFLRLWAGGGELAGGEAEGARSDLPEKLPSRRRLAGLLGIPRGRFVELFEILGGLVRDWYAANLPKRAVTEKHELEKSLICQGQQGRSG